MRSKPSYLAERQIAVSEIVPRKSPVVLRTDRVEPAAISVVIEDGNGQPVPGVVLLDATGFFVSDQGFQGHEPRAASSDARGQARFMRARHPAAHSEGAR